MAKDLKAFLTRIKEDSAFANEVREKGKSIMEAEKISSEDTSAPIMENAQTIYAGLTYGKGSLNETYLNAQDYNRGFKA